MSAAWTPSWRMIPRSSRAGNLSQDTAVLVCGPVGVLGLRGGAYSATASACASGAGAASLLDQTSDDELREALSHGAEGDHRYRQRYLWNGADISKSLLGCAVASGTGEEAATLDGCVELAAGGLAARSASATT